MFSTSEKVIGHAYVLGCAVLQCVGTGPTCFASQPVHVMTMMTMMMMMKCVLVCMLFSCMLLVSLTAHSWSLRRTASGDKQLHFSTSSASQKPNKTLPSSCQCLREILIDFHNSLTDTLGRKLIFHKVV